VKKDDVAKHDKRIDEQAFEEIGAQEIASYVREDIGSKVSKLRRLLTKAFTPRDAGAKAARPGRPQKPSR
jgi:hypothetical protein